MIEHDKDDLINLVQHYRDEAAAYWRQWTLWLSVGSAGAAIAFISFAAKLPNPNYAFRLLAPSLWSFLIGLIAAAICLPLAALRARSTGEHFAASHNRAQLKNAIGKLPEVFSAPESTAIEMNRPRNELIKKHDQEHKQAEAAWAWRSRWNCLMMILLWISALAFVAGVSWPLVYVSRGGSLTP